MWKCLEVWIDAALTLSWMCVSVCCMACCVCMSLQSVGCSHERYVWHALCVSDLVWMCGCTRVCAHAYLCVSVRAGVCLFLCVHFTCCVSFSEQCNICGTRCNYLPISDQVSTHRQGHLNLFLSFMFTANSKAKATRQGSTKTCEAWQYCPIISVTRFALSKDMSFSSWTHVKNEH